TAPVGCEPGAADFFNTVVAVQIDPSVAPQNFLARLRAIEIQLGRPAENLRARNVSRVIDLDLLYLGDSVLATPTLTLPHPRVSQRRFVLAPLAALRPHLILPGQRANVAALLAALGPAETDDAAAVRLVAAHW
ncbi:MAG: 2-amino-4-hydroxy-6-hydroxymethyldihydropteridine diphosphokinase, partial [Verrucomicrobia bacterium]|nr:2-amino-4-hydroxy-6-hydroxymethyldihydropteridine diphosphokinase [Verrucomicrobiota bacterium]